MGQIGAGAEDHVDAASGGAAELDLIGALANLKLLDRIRDQSAGGAVASAILGEVRLVIVIAFDHVVIEASRRAAEAQQTEAAVAGDAGLEQGEIVVAAAVDREVVDFGAVY